MKILSFDVGIINLAYCILEKNINSVNIIDWNIINLDDKRQKCDFIIRSNKKCDKYASHSVDKPLCLSPGTPIGTSLNLCVAHCKAYIKVNKNIIDSSSLCTAEQDKISGSSKSNFKCNYVKTDNIACNKNSHYKIDDKILCTPHYKIYIKNKKNEIVPQKLTKHNSNKIYVQTLIINLFNKLDEHENFMDVDVVLIENQPTFINPTMKNISSSLFSYFSLRGLIDKKNNSIIKDVRFVSPLNKLKIAQDILKKETTDKYKLTKNLSVKYCKALINEENLIFLNSHTKKDDLADSFLQGFFILFQNELPDEYKNKLDKVLKEINETNI